MKFEIKGDMLLSTHAKFEREAEASNRTPAQHLGHILSRRYKELRRVCECGFFVYRVTDDLSCHTCGARCCPWCGTSLDDRDYCHRHPPAKGGVTRHGR